MFLQSRSPEENLNGKLNETTTSPGSECTMADLGHLWSALRKICLSHHLADIPSIEWEDMLALEP